MKYIYTRITPAYAGKSYYLCDCRLHAQDHPRLRGEKKKYKFFELDGEGSPPLTRGKEGSQGKFAGRRGITPAYAGKRDCSRLQQLAAEDHPRLRGEKANLFMGVWV